MLGPSISHPVTGKIVVPSTKTYYATPCFTTSIEGTIAAAGIVNDGTYEFGLTRGAVGSVVNWEIGEAGLSGTKHFTIGNTDGAHATVKAAADFTIAARIDQYRKLTLDTAGYTITIGDGQKGAIIPVSPAAQTPEYYLTAFTGSGVVVANYDVSTSGFASRSGPLAVQDGATLVLKSGANLGTGLLTVEDGATLKVAESGTVTLNGNLALDDGAALAFNWTDRRTDPRLALATGKSLTLGEGGLLSVEVSSTCGKPNGGEHLLTGCGGFADATLTLVPVGDADQWAKGVSAADGDIALDIERMGAIVIVL